MDAKDESSFDVEGILLEPVEEGVESVCNPAVFQDSQEGPWPFLYRCTNSEGTSVINLRQLVNPAKLSREHRTLIWPTEDYESGGCEDPGLVKIDGVGYIPYVGWDKVSARICLATTTNFKEIRKWGVIGPQILIEEGIDLVPGIYKSGLERYLEGIKESGADLKRAFVWDKDPVIEYNHLISKWVLIHRIDPHAHIAVVNSLDELIGEKGEEYWREHFRNLDEHILMENQEPWESGKVGFACFAWLRDKKIGIYHGVDENLVYRVGICEVDPKSYVVVSKLRDPVLMPDGDAFVFRYKDKEGQDKQKRVIFPKGSIVDEKTRRLYIYFGLADTRIGFRSIDIDWVYKELDNPHNRVDRKELASVQRLK